MPSCCRYPKDDVLPGWPMSDIDHESLASLRHLPVMTGSARSRVMIYRGEHADSCSRTMVFVPPRARWRMGGMIRLLAKPMRHWGRASRRRRDMCGASTGRSLFIGLLCFVGAWPLSSANAQADEWGCQVILCLANPGGPGQYAQCEPPIERLWRALRRGDPFPTCDVAPGSSQATFASNIFAGAGYCREDLLYWGGTDQSVLLCAARGAINVDIDGTLYTRVWWDVNEADRTITEFYGGGQGTGSYDPTQSASLFLSNSKNGESGDGGGE
jgi:hypothetical protein